MHLLPPAELHQLRAGADGEGQALHRHSQQVLTLSETFQLFCFTVLLYVIPPLLLRLPFHFAPETFCHFVNHGGFCLPFFLSLSENPVFAFTLFCLTTLLFICPSSSSFAVHRLCFDLFWSLGVFLVDFVLWIVINHVNLHDVSLLIFCLIPTFPDSEFLDPLSLSFVTCFTILFYSNLVRFVPLH